MHSKSTIEVDWWHWAGGFLYILMIKTTLFRSERTRTNHLLLTDRSQREPVSIPKVSATRSSRFVARLQYPAYVEEAWNDVEDVISGVDAVAPRSTPSPRIPSYRRQKGGTGGSVSGEDHLDAFSGCFPQLLTWTLVTTHIYLCKYIWKGATGSCTLQRGIWWISGASQRVSERGD